MSRKVDREPSRAIVNKDGVPWCDCGGEVLLIHDRGYGKIGILRGRCASCNTPLRVKFGALTSQRHDGPSGATPSAGGR